jgi:hypothetical protein
MVDSLRSAQGGRPILTQLLPVPHAAFGLDADGHLAIALGLSAATSLCFFLVLRALGMELTHAGAIAALVLVFPWSDSIRLWGNVGVNNVAVCLYLLGVVVALRGLRATGARAVALQLVAAALYAASVLTYEAAFVAALLSVLLYANAANWRAALRRWPADLAAVGGAVAWTAAHTTKDTASLRTQLGHVPEMSRDALGLIARATLPFGGRSLVLGVAVLLLVAIAARLYMRLPVGDPDRGDLRRWLLTAAAALACVGAAYAALVPSAYPTALKPGLENRFNILAALPMVVLAYALVMVAATLAGRVLGVPRRRLGVVCAVAACLLGAGYLVRTERDETRWDRAAAFASRVLRAVEAQPRPPSGTTVYSFRHPAQTAPGVPVFFDTWDMNGAVRLVWGDPTLRGFPVYDGARFSCDRDSIRPLLLPTPRGRLDTPSAEQDPRNGPYWGPARAAPYGRALFVDVPSGRGELIRDQGQCRSATRRYRPGPFEAG